MPELLIVGGLTVDRFADGRRAAGGSVLHAAVAASGEGVRPTMATVAGEEPEARAGLDRLRAMGQVVVQASPRTTTYAHSEVDGRRVLVLEASSDPIQPAALPNLPVVEVALRIVELRAVGELVAGIDVLHVVGDVELDVPILREAVEEVEFGPPPVELDEMLVGDRVRVGVVALEPGEL